MQLVEARRLIDKHEIWKCTDADSYNIAADHLAREISNAVMPYAKTKREYRPTEPRDGFVEDGLVPVDLYGARDPCDYCRHGSYSGLPGGACENCMNTGLKCPQLDIDPPCTCCDDLGITKQTERACDCAAGDQYKPAA